MGSTWRRLYLFVDCWTCKTKIMEAQRRFGLKPNEKEHKHTAEKAKQQKVVLQRICMPTCKTPMIRNHYNCQWHWLQNENHLNTFHSIFSLKRSLSCIKKQALISRLLLLGSDNGHVVKHWFETIKIPHVRGMQGSHYTCHCPMARLLVHFYSSQLTCC